MQAIDACVAVRCLTRDDPGQAAKARAVVESGNAFVATTAVLEAEWVLRSVYGLSSRDVADALLAFAGAPGVSHEDPALLAGALARARIGMDFADALRFGAAANREEMLTFDRWFIEPARGGAVRETEP